MEEKRRNITLIYESSERVKRAGQLKEDEERETLERGTRRARNE